VQPELELTVSDFLEFEPTAELSNYSLYDNGNI